jgi:hypothetical protein
LLCFCAKEFALPAISKATRTKREELEEERIGQQSIKQRRSFEKLSSNAKRHKKRGSA